MNTELRDYTYTLSLMAPPPKLTISQWADERRWLSPEASSDPGKWDTARAEFQRQIMDAISNPLNDTVVFMSSSQVGKTEIINNVVGYYIDYEPGPMMVVQESVKPMAEAWSKDRLAPMIRDTPSLKNKVKAVKARNSGNTILHKVFPGGHLTISGSNSPGSLASRPIRIVLFDEIDRYPKSSGAEGDPVSLGIQRTNKFWNRKIVLISTPTIKGESRIEKAWNETEQNRYFVPCPDCGHFQYLKWANVQWLKDDDGQHLPKTAIYACEKCGSCWEDVQRWEAVSKGEWRATGKAKREGKTGYHIWEAYWPGTPLKELVDLFLEKKDDPQQFKTFFNLQLGEPWEVRRGGLNYENLYKRREEYAATVPDGVLLLTASVDVQGDRLEVDIKGWGIGEQCWGIKYQVIYNHPDKKETWDELEKTVWEQKYKHESGIDMHIACMTIDSGGMQGHTDMVYKFVQRMMKKRRRIFAIKGSSRPGMPIISKPSYTNKYGVPLFSIGTDTAKEKIYARLEIKEPGPRYFHFPMGYDYDYFQMLTVEYFDPEKAKWICPPGKRNEALDLFVYNFAALEIMNPNFEAIAESFKREVENRNNLQEEIEQPKQRRKPRKKINNWGGDKW